MVIGVNAASWMRFTTPAWVGGLPATPGFDYTT